MHTFTQNDVYRMKYFGSGDGQLPLEAEEALDRLQLESYLISRSCSSEIKQLRTMWRDLGFDASFPTSFFRSKEL